jgi:hypothetical protein
MNEINRTELEFEKDSVYFKWSKPVEPNGIIFKYNIKLVDIISNKVCNFVCNQRLFLNYTYLRLKVHYVMHHLII